MLLRTIRITNFRGLPDVEIAFDETTVLIGENNVGKSSVLDAIRLTLTRALARRGGSPFDEEEYRLASGDDTARDASPIEIELDFAESKPDEWPDELVQRLNDIIVFADDDRRHIILRVKSGFDSTIDDFVVEWRFRDTDGTDLPQKSNSPQNLVAFLGSTPMHYLSAFRNTRDEFSPRGQYFRAYVRQPGLPQLGVRIVNYGWSGPEPLLKVANDFGILWLITPDGDQAGTATVTRATEYLQGDAPARRIHQLSAPNLELLLAGAGYGAVYEAHVSPQKAASITAAHGTPEYWQQVRAARDGTKKPALALEVAPLMRANGVAGIPAEIAAILQKVKTLAEE